MKSGTSKNAHSLTEHFECNVEALPRSCIECLTIRASATATKLKQRDKSTWPYPANTRVSVSGAKEQLILSLTPAASLKERKTGYDSSWFYAALQYNCITIPVTLALVYYGKSQALCVQ